MFCRARGAFFNVFAHHNQTLPLPGEKTSWNGTKHFAAALNQGVFAKEWDYHSREIGFRHAAL